MAKFKRSFRQEVLLLVCILSGAFAQKQGKKKTVSPSPDTTAWRRAIGPFTRGVVLFSQGLTEEAADFLEKSVEVAPHSAGIHYYLSRVAYAQGDPIRMLTHAEKAYHEAPHELGIALHYAFALQLNNQFQAALTLLESLVKKYPDHPELLLQLAEAYRDLKEVDKADAYYAQFQYLTGSYEEIFQTRVQLFVEAGQIRRAIALAESLATLFPRHEIYLETAARLYELQKDLNGMASAVMRLIQTDPANATAWEIALAYAELFDEIWGEENWERFLEQPTIPPEIKYFILRRLPFLEEQEALATLQKLLQESPTAAGWDLYAHYWAAQQRWDSAAYAWREALREDSTQLSFYSGYFYALCKLGGGDSLFHSVERAAELFPGQGRIYLWQGIAHALRGETLSAMSAFERGWRLFHPPTDTLTAQVASYYYALLRPSSQSRSYLFTFYPNDLAEALWLTLRLRNGESLPMPEKVPFPYDVWMRFLIALRENRPEEATNIAAEAVDTSATLPLEMWGDILRELGKGRIGALYEDWKRIARSTYPLARLWDELP